jgi:hypothetical protein
MNNRTLQLMIIMMIAAVTFLLALNIAPYFTKNAAGSASSLHINAREVKGSSVIYMGKTYTLNFDQQNILIDGLNAAIPVGANDIFPEKIPDYGQFEIYFFNDSPKLVLKPVGVVGSNLVFKIPEWNKEGWIKDVTDGRLLNLLKNSHSDIP